jgi:hypothetical protein
MVKQVKTEEIKITAHKWVCPKCAKEIIGSTPQQVAFNSGLHLDSHKGDKK